MKIRKSAASGVDKVDQQMTPMIDVVFQLLTFFMLSFKIVAPEGDFNIKMPVAAQAAPSIEDPTLPIKVRLESDGEGKLVAIKMNDRPIASFDELRLQVIGIVGGDAGPGSSAENTECEIDADYQLRYDYVMKAIDAVSGYKEGGKLVKLIQKIRFSPPKKP